MKSLLDRYKNMDRKAPNDLERTNEETRNAKRPRPEESTAAYADAPHDILFQCLEGSVTHFYHFFYGAMIPLILHSIENTQRTNTYRILTDIGPMKRILCELPINIIEIKGPERLGDGMIFHDDKSLRRQPKPHEIVLQAFDAYNKTFYTDEYVEKMTKSKLKKIIQFFEDTIPYYIRSIPVFEILLIERSTDAYYASGCSDRSHIYQISGSERRSLSNHKDLVDTLSLKYGDRFCNIVLERSSIYYQYHMFKHARVVIAQHGAALANTLFMMDTNNSKGELTGKGVVEISPPWSREFEHFKNLAHACNVPHVNIWQAADHSCTDIAQVRFILDTDVEVFLCIFVLFRLFKRWKQCLAMEHTHNTDQKYILIICRHVGE